MKLTRALWTESATFKKERRVRFGLLAPVALVAGGIWGSLLGTGTGILAGAGIFLGGAYLHTRIHPALMQLAEARRTGSGRMASFLFDLVVVGGGGLLLTRGFGMPWSPAVGTALAAGGGAALAFSWLFGEGGTRFFGGILSPMHRSGYRAPTYSHVEARMIQGDHEGARAALEDIIEDHPKEVQGWVRLARLLAGPLGEPEEALRALEDGLRAVRGSDAREVELVRQVVLLREMEGDAVRALPLVARYQERWKGVQEREWADATMARLKARIEGGLGARPLPAPGSDPADDQR